MGYQERLRFTAGDGAAWTGMLRPDWAVLEPLLSQLAEDVPLQELLLQAGLQLQAPPELPPPTDEPELEFEAPVEAGEAITEDLADPAAARPSFAEDGASTAPPAGEEASSEDSQVVLLPDGRSCVLWRLPPVAAWLPRASRAKRRFELIHRLWALGVPAVRALAYLEGPRSRPSWLLTEACAAEPLPRWADRASLRARRDLAEQLGRAIGRLKRAGLPLELQADGWCVEAGGPRLGAVREASELPEAEWLAELAAGLPTRPSERLAFLRGYLQHELGGAKARRRALLAPSR